MPHIHFTASRWVRIASVAAFAFVLGAHPARASSDPPGGLGFVTIGNPGNAPYPGGPSGERAGIGQVDYEFRMGRSEVTTAQWLDFVNAVDTFDPGLARDMLEPNFWGGRYVGGAPGSGRWELSTLPNAETLAVGGMSWRSAAMYCNWLHNDRAPTLEAISRGAYDTSTFTINPDGTYNDQRTRSPEAKYWLPSEDEWTKGAYYSPDRYGVGAGGWWTFPNQSETAPVTGLPGTPGAETSADLADVFLWLDIPLGAYPETQSYYGLIDITGGAREWMETASGDTGRDRRTDGSWIGAGAGAAEFYDVAWRISGSISANHGHPLVGFRLASSVPAPPITLVLGLSIASAFRSRRKRGLSGGCHG